MTEEEKQDIILEVVNTITTNSISINDAELVGTVDNITQLSGVKSLPCSKTDGTIVSVALETFVTPIGSAIKSALTATNNANKSAENANEAVADYTALKSNTIEPKIEECEAATNKAIEASNNIGNKKILVITEEQYTKLLEGETITVDGVDYSAVDSNTIYFCTEE